MASSPPSPSASASASERFSFQRAFAERAKKELAKYPEGRKQSAVLALLDLAQRQNTRTNCVTDAAMETIAAMLSLSRLRLEEIASFYTMIHRKPVGKYHLQCCRTTPCMLRGGDLVQQRIEETLGIRNLETTADGRFTLSQVECLGACSNAPVVQINDDMYEDLTGDDMENILAQLKKGEIPQAGSQHGRRGAEPQNQNMASQDIAAIAPANPVVTPRRA